MDEDARDNELAMHNGALNGLSMTSLAEAYAALGDMPNALRWLNLAVDSHDGDAIYLRVAWQFANFQNTPEFHRLKKRLNLDW